MRALSARQEKFVEHYAICSNATEAARLAGYSAKTARVIGSENLLKPAIKEAVEGRQRVFAQELRITKGDVLAGLLNALDDAILLGEDAGRYPELAGRPRRSLEGGVRGAAVALMGSDPSRAALPPDRVRIDYLRAPDIGPTRPSGS